MYPTTPSTPPAHFARRLRLRYLLALSLIAGLSILGHLAFASCISKSSIEGRRINIAGRQRMLSQRLLVKTQQVTHTTSQGRSRALAELAEVLAVFERAHHALLHGDRSMGLERGVPDQIALRYEREGLDGQVRDYIDRTRAWMEGAKKGPMGQDSVNALVTSGESLLPQLHEAVGWYEAHNEAQIWRLKQLSLLLLLALCLTLCVEVGVVFEPACRALKQQFDRLERGRVELEQRHQQLGQIMAQTGDAMLTVDEAGRAGSFCSKTASTWFGAWESGQGTFWEYVAQGDEIAAAKIKALFGTFLGSGRAQTSALFFLGERCVNLSLCDLEEEGVAQVLVTMSDMTDARRQRMAEEASQAKSTFLANMSHELRTPLNAVLGYTEILREECLVEAEEGGELLNCIIQAGHHLLGLIGNILDLTKLEAGQMAVHREVFALDALVHEVSLVAAPLAGRQGNRFEHVVDLERPEMRCDQEKVRQILLNLLSNAAKFTTGGLISMSVHDECRAGAERWMVVTVKDTGMGIGPGAMGKLFGAFVRSDDSHTRPQDGMGLGLAISQRFALLLGGGISVHSAPGEGSTFTLELPSLSQDGALLI